MLAQDGEHGLQMKQLAERADVALATLYRYFPSKDHVLGAIALKRQRRALHRIDSIRLDGDTAGDRAGDLMVRQFRAVQREPELATALQRVTNAPDRATSEYVEGISRLMEELVITAVEQGGAGMTDEQRSLLPLVLAASVGAFNRWLSGVASAEEARAQIRAGARLLDLPAGVVREYLSADRAGGAPPDRTGSAPPDRTGSPPPDRTGSPPPD
jgi:AcrR family transcriptional regulator